MNFTQKVWAACKKIPKGRVSTYALIAKAVGNPRASRAVGNALNKNRSKSVPCHRVVKSDGKVGGFALGSKAKEKLLKRESVRIIRGRVQQFVKAVFKGKK